MNTVTSHLTLGFLLLLAGTLVLQAEAAAPQPGEPAPTNAPGVDTASTNCLGPRIQFATREPSFGRVTKGETVKYTYIFTNTGDRVLHVLGVQPGCGCTRAGEWTKAVEPGKTGSIPIQLATENYQGDVIKFVTVTCDDKSITNGAVMLQLKGNIWTPVQVIPQYLNFVIPYDAPGGSTTATITNHLSEPLYLSPPQSSNPGFTAELKTNAVGKSYQLVVTRVPPIAPGTSQTTITLKTSFTNPPTITAIAWANVQLPVTVLPSQLTVGPAPLSNPAPYTIVIQNATTNLMALSDPQVSAKDVKVELKELQPGRYFNALLTFPLGFEIPPGQQVAFTVKSSLTNTPVITVPIFQLSKPATPLPATVPRAAATPRVPRVGVR